MRSLLPPLALLAAFTLSVPAAHADADSIFSITGPDAYGNTYTLDLFINASWGFQEDLEGGLIYGGLPATVNGTPVPVYYAYFAPTYFFVPGGVDIVENLYLQGQYSYEFPAYQFGGLPIQAEGDPETGDPIGSYITPGTYNAQQTCNFSNLTGPIPLDNCDDNITLTVTTPTDFTITPEPSTLALLGTGALGVFGVLRRRLF